MTELRAYRVRKARRSTRCESCGAMIQVGENIGLVAPGDWRHCSCIIAPRWGSAYQVSAGDRQRAATERAVALLRQASGR